MSISKEIKSRASITTQLRNKADGRHSIRLVVIVDGKRSYERVPDLFILPEVDDESIRKNKAVLNKIEKIRKHRLNEIYEQLKGADEKESVNAEEVAASSHKMMLSEWISEFYNIQKARGIHSLRRVAYLAKHLSMYGKDILLADIDKEYCLGFIEHLRSDYKKENGECICQKTAFDTLGVLNTALNAAIYAGKLMDNPISKLSASDKFKPLEHKREYLTMEELQKLIDTPCKNNVVKQAFLFACNCGMRYGDIEALTWGEITKSEDHLVVATKMSKTKRVVRVPLPQQAQQWLPKRRAKDKRVFDGLSEYTCCKYLKEWSAQAGITNKKVEFPTARHTYATMLLTLGADIYTVSKLLGHTSIRHTQRYAKIVNKKKDDAIKLLDNL